MYESRIHNILIFLCFSYSLLSSNVTNEARRCPSGNKITSKKTHEKIAHLQGVQFYTTLRTTSDCRIFIEGIWVFKYLTLCQMHSYTMCPYIYIYFNKNSNLIPFIWLLQGSSRDTFQSRWENNTSKKVIKFGHLQTVQSYETVRSYAILRPTLDCRNFIETLEDSGF
jgi:hypothetical protein